MRCAVRFLFVASIALWSGCAPRAPLLPTGAGAPFPEFKAAYDEATASCRAVKTVTASMAMSGKAGTMKLRGIGGKNLIYPATITLVTSPGSARQWV